MFQADSVSLSGTGSPSCRCVQVDGVSTQQHQHPRFPKSTPSSLCSRSPRPAMLSTCEVPFLVLLQLAACSAC